MTDKSDTDKLSNAQGSAPHLNPDDTLTTDAGETQYHAFSHDVVTNSDDQQYTPPADETSENTEE